MVNGDSCSFLRRQKVMTKQKEEEEEQQQLQKSK